MNIFIDINESVYNTCKNHSEIKDILYDLGFDAIKNPIMFNTVARKISIKKALDIKKVSEDKLIEKFRENGFDIANRNSILKDLIMRMKMLKV